MGYPLAAMAGATFLGRAAAWFATSRTGQTISQVLYNPFVQSGQFGIGYTGGAYLGYGASNTWDPLGLHNKSYKHGQLSILRMPYGSYGYGRRRYRSRYGRRYRSRYGYRRRSYRSRYYRRYY